ncbi:hypothetical protein GALMADRAFT_253433 [Galerina marginata CBS 339.88]|uniref:Protein kinase domain-containing protein n=1 Tax=Galerina marginata (strain CBS 339.88) TaxID=685588 RepID=A0A067SNU5_GALM3|nr:hypothetical protein GALMADRAFT_253433 [Galerina marginata CBS 339.88]
MIPILAQNNPSQAIPIAAQTPKTPNDLSGNQSSTPLQSTDIPVSVLQTRARLHDFFQNRPPALWMGKGHTASTNTRDTAYFDMHLHKNLRLKRVVFCDDLLNNLSDFCDELILNSPEFPPVTGNSFECNYPEPPPIIDEQTLQSYCTAISSFYLEVATGLRFKTSWDKPAWMIGESPADSRRKFAAADGYLFPDFRQKLSEGQQSDYKLLEAYGLAHFVIWEYKNLACGPKMFEDLRELEGEFTWTTCQERSNEDEESASCPYNVEQHRTQGRLRVTGRRTGPDSTVIQKFLQSKHLHPQPPTDSQQSAGPSTSSRPPAGEQPPQGSKRPADNHDSGPLPKRRRVSAKTSKGASAAVHKKALLLQQAWAEAVSEDATFVIISAGNHEYIGIRLRGTQTFYLSPLIKPSEDTAPAHSKIQVATFIAAFDDALNRARQLQTLIATRTLSQQFPRLFLLRLDEVPESSKILENFVPKDIEPADTLSSEWTDESILARLTSNYSSISLRNHGRKPDIVSKSLPKTWTLNHISTSTSDADVPSTTLFLDLEGLLPNSSRVSRVFLGLLDDTLSAPYYYSKPLVLKIAISPQEKQRLAREFTNYRLLHAETVGSVVQQYGHYSCEVKNGVHYHFLLLEDGGPSLMSRATNQLSRHLDGHSDAYKTALDAFHRKGFVHENLSSDHILMRTDNPDGAANLISLSGCIKPAKDLAKACSNELDVMTNILVTQGRD